MPKNGIIIMVSASLLNMYTGTNHLISVELPITA